MTTIDFLKECLAYYKLTSILPYNTFEERITTSQLRDIPLDQLYDLGFGNWDSDLLLLPLWALDLISPGETLTCISGQQAVVGQDSIDDDVRGGCVAWGFKP